MPLDSEAEARFAATGDSRIAQQILEPLRSPELAPVWQQMVALARPSARLIPVTEGQSPASKLGGRPDVGAGFDWPRDPDGVALSFIAQIELTEVNPICRNDVLPKTGLVALFYDAIRSPAGHQPSDRGHWSIHHSRGPVQPAAQPVDLSDEYRFKEVFLNPTGELTLPALRTLEVENLHLTDAQEDAYLAVRQRIEEQHFPGAIHRALGWPEEIQHDPSSYAQLPANGLNSLNPDVYKTSEAQRLLAERAIWQLIVQIDSEDAAGMLWGDDGRLYVMLREPDLRERAWDRAWLSQQDY